MEEVSGVYSRFFKPRPVVHTCSMCNFRSKRRSHFQIHCNSTKHRKLCRVSRELERDNLELEDKHPRHPCTSRATTTTSATQQLEVEMDSNINNRCGTHSHVYTELEGESFEETMNGTDDCDEDFSHNDDVASGETETERESGHIEDGSWYPFPNKISFLLYVLLHSKTHSVSDELARYILFILRECGVNTPSLNSLKRMQFGDYSWEKMLLKATDEDGVPFWIIKPSELLKLMIANPQVSSCIIRYPQTANQPKEQANGQKWLKQIKSPWARHGQNIYFLGDFVEFTLEDEEVNAYGKIMSFVDNKETDNLCVNLQVFVQPNHPILQDIHDADYPQKCLVRVSKTDYMCPTFKIRPTGLTSSFFELMELGEDKSVHRMSEEESIKAHWVSNFKTTGLPVVSLPVNLFIDDTSTNKSRRWLPFHCIQLQLAGLPLTQRPKGQHCHYISASEKANVLDMTGEVLRDVQNMQKNGIKAFDAKERRETMITSDVALVVADYNMVALVSNHMGAAANKFCSRCHAEKDSCTSKGRERTTNETIETLRTIQTANTNKRKQELQKASGLKYYPNCTWSFLDPHRDTPVGMLHWMYLGLAKHLLTFCVGILTPRQKEMFIAHLEDLDQSSFDTPLKGDVILNINSRQGKDFKQLLQVAAFGMQYVGLQQDLIKMICELALLNKDINTTPCDVPTIDQRIRNYLNLVEEHAPHLKNKVKTHLSTHLVDDITEHGPPAAYNEDAFEKQHGAIRQQLFTQNQLARSRDSAKAFAEHELLMHILAGGFFQDKGKWRAAADNLKRVGAESEICRMMGIAVPTMTTYRTGTLSKAMGRDKCNRPLILPATDKYKTHGNFITFFKAVRCADGRLAKKDNYVSYRDNAGQGSNRKYSLSSKTGTLLPEFPSASNLILPKDMDVDKLETFIMMYRTHCQRILDTVISANFDEVQNFLLHFWQGMPGHLLDLLSYSLITDLVGMCDSILYKVLIDVLIPSSIQDVPDSLGSEIKGFIRRIPVWIDNALETIPDSLRVKKMEVRWFIKATRRQMSFLHLAQTARAVLLNHDSVSQMVEDLSAVDFTGLCCQAEFTQQSPPTSEQPIMMQCFGEFQTLLNKQAPIESYTEWVDTMVDRCVLKPCEDIKQCFKDRAAEFLLQWAVYNSLIMRDLTLLSASSFGSFHLIHMMLDEYVFLVMETQLYQLKERELLQAVQKQMKKAGEINMQAKVRLQPNKFQNSPKSRKRKIEDSVDSEDETESISAEEINARIRGTRSCIQSTGTAFSRPTAHAPNHQANLAVAFPENGDRGVIQHSANTISPVKHMTLTNAASTDRSSYFPSFNINSYDFVSPGNSFTSPRLPALTDSHHLHSQGFGTVSLSGTVPPAAGSYWSETRQHPSFGDPYSSYSYNKFTPSCDTYNKSGLLRNGSYSDSFNRSAFEASRGYYGRPHDGFQVGSSLSVGSYGANFMDIAPPTGQYGRQEPMIFQEDVFANSIGTLSAFNKSYLTASFR